MSRVNEEFGKAVQEKLRERGWSHQRAWIATTIPGATIGRMALGLVPGEDHIIKWATALGENVNSWLELAGYDPIPEELVRETKSFYSTVMVDDIEVRVKSKTEKLSPEALENIQKVVRDYRDSHRKEG